MLKHKNRILSLIIFIASILALTSCSIQNKKESYYLFSDANYEVCANINGMEHNGIVTIGEEEIKFQYTDNTSPLFGLEETLKKESFETHFYNIVWKSEAVAPPTQIFYDIFSLINHSNTENTEIKKEEETIEYIFHAENDLQFSLFADKNTKIPQKIVGANDKTVFDITFLN